MKSVINLVGFGMILERFTRIHVKRWIKNLIRQKIKMFFDDSAIILHLFISYFQMLIFNLAGRSPTRW